MKIRSDKHNTKELPMIEDTEFAEEQLVQKAIQRAYRQSGIEKEPLTEEEE